MNDDTQREIQFESDGATLFAVESGRGLPVILLHGALANHLACRVIAGSLSERFRLITPDLRGSGRSIHRGPLTWAQLADDVAALMRHLALPRAVVGGVSFGSGCAVRFALQHPDFVAGLILLTPAFLGANAGLTPAQRAALGAMHAAGLRAVDEGMSALFPLLDRLPEALRARARAVVSGYDPRSVAATTGFLASGEQPFASAADLAEVAVPTLVVPGTDPYHPPEVSDLYARTFPRCTRRDVTGDAIAGAIADFLDREIGGAAG
jgi:pimeloyl-ACP methyl ester carboxylesterase